MAVQPCPNIYRRQLAQHLGREIVGAPTISSSPLLKLNPDGGSPLVDMTKHNLLIEGCSWRGLLAHLKYTLVYKGLNHVHKVITDERIKNVFVGSESYKSRSTKVRDDVETVNSIPDLVSSDYQLLIIKLGYLGYPNKAAAGALKEALLHRESIGLPTWLVHDPERGWTHSYDPDVGQYVEDRFASLSIEPVTGYEPYSHDAAAPEEGSGISVDTEDPPSEAEALVAEDESTPPAPPTPRRVRAPVQQPREEEPTLGNDISLPGSNQPPRRRNNWGRDR